MGWMICLNGDIVGFEDIYSRPSKENAACRCNTVSGESFLKLCGKELFAEGSRNSLRKVAVVSHETYETKLRHEAKKVSIDFPLRAARLEQARKEPQEQCGKLSRGWPDQSGGL